MRIFCGLTNVDDVVSAAVVNERGGVIATAEVADAPSGYVDLCRMWVRYGAVSQVSVADDGSTQVLMDLAIAGGHGVAAVDFGQDGSDDPTETAVHIAGMLASGELVAYNEVNHSRAMQRIVNSMHAMAHSGFAGQNALIDVLRHCHPAALAAWEDPTDRAALELLSIVPEPADAAEADPKRLADQLRDRVDPRRVSRMVTSLATASRSHDYQPDPGVAQAIAAAAESVLSYERASDALADSLARHLFGDQVSAPQAPPVPAPQASPEPAPEPEPQAQEPQPRDEPSFSDMPPLPNRARAFDQVPAEPPTLPLGFHTAPPDTLAPADFDEQLPEPGGFPQMPQPPSFVEDDLPTPQSQPAPEPVGDDAYLDSELPPGFDEADDDLLIFSQARSAWFKGPAAIDDDDSEAWSTPADEGWRAAAAVATSDAPASDTTGSGLPRRVPQANLVPGSAIWSDAPAVPISRDASTLARHTAGYFRGWGRARRETVGAGSR